VPTTEPFTTTEEPTTLPDPTQIMIDQGDVLYVKLGDTFQLSISTEPSETAYFSYSFWYSKDYFESNGWIGDKVEYKAISTGIKTIEAKTTDERLSDEITIYVYAEENETIDIIDYSNVEGELTITNVELAPQHEWYFETEQVILVSYTYKNLSDSSSAYYSSSNFYAYDSNFDSGEVHNWNSADRVPYGQSSSGVLAITFDIDSEYLLLYFMENPFDSMPSIIFKFSLN
jgi:hypothetical protein